MRYIFALVISVTAFSATTFACEGESMPFSGDTEIQESFAAKQVLCSHEGVEAEASLGEFAIYRCMNSPTYHLLRFGKNSFVARGIEVIDANSFKVLTHTRADQPVSEVICRFKEAAAPLVPADQPVEQPHDH